MKKILSIIVVVIAFTLSDLKSQQYDYKTNWANVQSMEVQGLSKSALTIVNEIFNHSKADNSYPEFLKALIYKLKFKSNIEENVLFKIINETESITDSASFPVKPVLHSMLAEMYWWYFQNNRYKFYNRSRTLEVISDDISTWDLTHLVVKVMDHYKASLENRDLLKEISLNDFRDVMFINNKNEKNIHPSLFDFLALRALEFYSNEESHLPLPVDEFSINNDVFILPTDSFAKISIQTTDTLSFYFQAINLFQQLIRFHLNDPSPEALVDLDLKRIKFIDGLLTSEERDKLYLEALYHLERRSKGYLCEPEIGLEIAERLFELGELYNPQVSQQHRWEKDSAIMKCLAVKSMFPRMAKECNELIEKIHAKNIKLTLEKESIPNQPSKALLSYRNADSAYIAIIKTSYDQIKKYLDKYDKEYATHRISWDEYIIPILTNQKTLVRYTVSLPADKDYQEHSAEIKIPSLEAGVYIILAGTDKSLDYRKNCVAFGITNITSISFINRRGADGDNDFYFLNRKTGEPLIGAEVECWATEYSYSERLFKPGLQGNFTTDMEGFVNVSKQTCVNKNFWFNISYNGEEWNTQDITWFYSGSCFYNQENYNYKDPCKIHTYFFTDRSIYRPGQTIYFKGIVIETDRKKINKIVPGMSMNVQLFNVNNQNVSNVNVTTNDYGSFSGTFVAPSNGLNGAMTIQGACGSKMIRVEDYKRPKFEVKFDTLRNSYRLNETVKVKGFAVAYSGASIDEATVKYRVIRRTNFYNWYWWFMPPSVPEKEIINGNTKTGKDGEFEISFKSIPDASIDASGRTSFTYTVFADVTDINGETHSSTSNISIGYQALIVNINLPEKVEKSLEKKEYKITTKNLNGDFVATSGNIAIVRLKNPEKVFSARKWGSPDKFSMSKEEFYKTFPTSPYSDELDPSAWEAVDTVYKTSFNTGEEKVLTLSRLGEWKSGMYKTIIQSKDIYNTPIEETSYFTVFDAKGKQVPYPVADWYVLDNSTLEPGDSAKVVFGSAFERINLLCEVEHQNKIVKREWLKLKKGQYNFSYPILEDYRGNIGIHYTYVIDNRLYTHNTKVTVPFTDKMLDISFETFRNKLQPGEKEQWKIRIKDKYGDKAAAELVTSLYDASLDVFSRHSFNFDILPRYSPYLNWNSNSGFNSYDARFFTLADYNTYCTEQNVYWLNWFGLESKLLGNSNDIFRNRDYLKSLKYQTGRRVTGIICDATTGEPLPGANIIVVGTTRGTITDINGSFSIMVPSLCRLEVSYLGYLSQFVSAKYNRKLKISLDPDIMALEEIVVVGYGTTGGDNEAAPQPSMERKEEDKTQALKQEDPVVLPQNDVAESKMVDFSNIQARANLNETAFFYPQLQTDENGDVLITFTIPEALTRWKMLGFAHSKDLKYGFIGNELITQKELMVVPNTPRFFREKDTITFTSKINSLSEKDLSGSIQLMLFDALTMKPIDAEMQNINAQQCFVVKRGSSVNLNWNIVVPEGLQAVTYRVVAKAGDYSDGEESTLPVLTNRMLVTESLPLPIKGRGTKTFTLDKMVHNTSTTLRNHKLTLEFTSNPAWYSIQALPYLMEYPYECAEQTFSRFYANSIASHIANSNPRIKQVFDSWKNLTPDALLSNLEKNQELKGILLEETPWVMQATDESERKQRVALLFDLNRMSDELNRSFNKLKKMQVSNGGWPWFEGMPDSWYITQHIVCGLGKLDHLGIKNIRNDQDSWRMINNAVAYLDNQIAEDYRELKRSVKAGLTSFSDDHLGYIHIHYLYARGFFNDISLSGDAKEAFSYYLQQSRKYWTRNDKYMQGMISLALHRFNDTKTAVAIIKSLKEHALLSDEMGMYWKNDYGWYWYQAPIETQAMMIEAFDEICNDSTAVNEMKVWLIKQKQTQDWKTTRATVEASYALLLRGTDWLTKDNQVEIIVGDKEIDPKDLPDIKVEAGTGYFKTSWNNDAIKPEMGRVTITKNDNGVSWGGLYWQYFEQLDKITPAETPLKLKKQLFVERNTNSGPVIQLITDITTLKPGDLLKVRIELRVDREMEYVHMKDMRAAGFEPVNVISRYKYQDGLGYYESTRDAATNFFFGWLPKGTYVFEYPLRVTHYGNFSNGITTIQCMYAPEFTSHSEGVRVVVKEK